MLLEGREKGLEGPDYNSTFNWPSDPYGGGGGDGLMPFAPDVDTHVAALISDLQYMSTRNFFFYGHGLPTRLSGAFTEVVGGKPERQPPYFTISVWTVASALGNIVQASNGILWWTRRHPYRVVILDACKTARTAHWCTAFGIGPSYYNDGTWRQPVQAFAGFSTFAYGPGFALEWVDYAETYDFIFTSWMSGATLAFCLNQAQLEFPAGGSGPHLAIPYGGGLVQWDITARVPTQIDGARLVILGYEKIKRVGFQ